MAIYNLVNNSPGSDTSSTSSSLHTRREGHGTWTADEHDRFVHAMSLYPNGPWRNIAAIIKTRSLRQTRTHAQKLKQKLARHTRGLRNQSSISQELAVYHPTWPYNAETGACGDESATQHDEVTFEESVDYFMHHLDHHFGSQEDSEGNNVG
ncbi:Aste57867_20588 [Aphanomyces stellatus]|uniref:Aste57867_20588 protein n=1 Tax=Aphanomyces stellatus TaxID=120398 RepID=A0A485LGR6_9STRA|nr:hypothetical protein As57867_020521 [Aphanomyces stellatus]VFT97269.1 Aste57867_20588 [Aphanomyces stellatus]